MDWIEVIEGPAGGQVVTAEVPAQGAYWEDDRLMSFFRTCLFHRPMIEWRHGLVVPAGVSPVEVLALKGSRCSPG
jgi:hypothetical protein